MIAQASGFSRVTSFSGGKKKTEVFSVNAVVSRHFSVYSLSYEAFCTLSHTRSLRSLRILRGIALCNHLASCIPAFHSCGYFLCHIISGDEEDDREN